MQHAMRDIIMSEGLDGRGMGRVSAHPCGPCITCTGEVRMSGTHTANVARITPHPMMAKTVSSFSVRLATRPLRASLTRSLMRRSFRAGSRLRDSSSHSFAPCHCASPATSQTDRSPRRRSHRESPKQSQQQCLSHAGRSHTQSTPPRCTGASASHTAGTRAASLGKARQLPRLAKASEFWDLCTSVKLSVARGASGGDAPGNKEYNVVLLFYTLYRLLPPSS